MPLALLVEKRGFNSDDALDRTQCKRSIMVNVRYG